MTVKARKPITIFITEEVNESWTRRQNSSESKVPEAVYIQFGEGGTILFEQTQFVSVMLVLSTVAVEQVIGIENVAMVFEPVACICVPLSNVNADDKGIRNKTNKNQTNSSFFFESF